MTLGLKLQVSRASKDKTVVRPAAAPQSETAALAMAAPAAPVVDLLGLQSGGAVGASGAGSDEWAAFDSFGGFGVGRGQGYSTTSGNPHGAVASAFAFHPHLHGHKASTFPYLKLELPFRGFAFPQDEPVTR